jgi:hypothetical protein
MPSVAQARKKVRFMSMAISLTLGGIASGEAILGISPPWQCDGQHSLSFFAMLTGRPSAGGGPMSRRATLQPKRNIGFVCHRKNPAAPAVKREAEEDWGR